VFAMYSPHECSRLTLLLNECMLTRLLTLYRRPAGHCRNEGRRSCQLAPSGRRRAFFHTRKLGRYITGFHNDGIISRIG